jgi:hypothetical protein
MSKPMNVYAPIERPDTGATFWIKLGIARVNRDGSINIYLDGLPLGGRLQLREKIEKTEKADARQDASREDSGREDSSDEGGR